ncbi:chloride transporter, chloride channel (ClC) family protein [Cardiosporidium cionae]|uniref:Chloride channel protein n=1 Tax=Cardiosporidium cionae TaxID=476202 RepID=A0ABQ7J8E3_9APIC|nr:chloride transporter, chloride channel (ClC) family protein [Cardiosporidium cionae]|eukprot:KAF8820266.1 chloride transporter, chloride channel (ClC) family protein [Cardiosporidium cionae]
MRPMATHEIHSNSSEEDASEKPTAPLSHSLPSHEVESSIILPNPSLPRGVSSDFYIDESMLYARQLSDFNTIDWRNAHDEIPPFEQALSHVSSSVPWYRQIIFSLKDTLGRIEGWILVALMSVLTAVTASYIEVAVEFMTDARLGFCSGIPFLNQRYCCGSTRAVDEITGTCIHKDILPYDGKTHFTRSNWMFWGDIYRFIPSESLYFFSNYATYTIIAALFAMLAALFVNTYSKRAAGSGIPEVKTVLGGFVMRKLLGGICLFTKCIGLCFAVASGLSLGKEGPFVHIACCWANIISRFSMHYSTNEAKKRELFSAAAASGVTVAFGAPLGGVLFSLEEVSTYFPAKTLWMSFFAAVTTAVCYKNLDPRATGRLSLFQLDTSSFVDSWHLFELIPFALLGIIGGILGAVFVHLNIRWISVRKTFGGIFARPVMEVMFVGCISAILCYPFPMLRILSSSLLRGLFSPCGPNQAANPFLMCASSSDSISQFSYYLTSSSIIINLCIAMSIKLILTVITFGTEVPAGLFIPSLAIGACYGRLMGLFMVELNESAQFLNCDRCIQPEVYALLGAASMLGGVTRMTISLVVIMFELTGGLTYIVPFMIVILISKWVGDALCEGGIYDCHILLKGYPYLHMGETDELTYRASAVMEKNLTVITRKGNTVASLLHLFRRYAYRGFPLVESTETNVLQGYIVVENLRHCLATALLKEHIHSNTMVSFDLPSCSKSPYRDETIISTLSRGIYTSDSEPSASSPFSYGTTRSSRTVESPVQIGTKKDLLITRDAMGNMMLNASAFVDAHPMQFISETPMLQIQNAFKQLGLR